MSLGREYRKLWAGNAAANFGDGVSFVAIPLLATAFTSAPALIAGLSLVYSVVRLLVVLPVGVYVDRLDRRSILWAANAVRGLVLIVLAGIVATGNGSLSALYVAFAVIGILETAADNAALSILPTVVSPEQLDTANGQISAAQLIADEFVGPPMGGLLFAAAIALPVAVTGGLYAVAALFFLGLRRTDRTFVGASARRSLFREAVAGGAWLRGHRLLAGLAIVGGLASVAYMMPFSILVLYSQKTLGLDSFGYGILLATSAVGGLIGSFAAAPLRARVGYTATITGSLALGAVTLAGMSLTDIPWIAALLLAAYILHAVVWGIGVNSLRQRLVPETLRGRVNAFSKLLGLIGLAVGAGVGGLLASTFGLAAPFVAGGAVFAVCAVTVWPLLRNWEHGQTRTLH
jgi:MFS family permease